MPLVAAGRTRCRTQLGTTSWGVSRPPCPGGRL